MDGLLGGGEADQPSHAGKTASRPWTRTQT